MKKDERCILCKSTEKSFRHYVCSKCLARIGGKTPQGTNLSDPMNEHIIRELSLLCNLEYGKKAVICKWQKYDGYKTVDICIEKSKLYIEVDGKHHQEDAEQVVGDLWRDYYSNKNGYLTLHVPNRVFSSTDDFQNVTNVIRQIAHKRAKKWWQFWK